MCEAYVRRAVGARFPPLAASLHFEKEKWRETCVGM
jgi:hypothetical protein